MSRLLELGGVKPDGFFGRNYYIKAEDTDALRRFIQARGLVDIYHTVFTYDSKDIDGSSLYGPLYIDIDGDLTEEGFEKARTDTRMATAFLSNMLAVPEKCIEIYFSGSKGFHLQIQPHFLGVNPEKRLNEMYRYIAGLVQEYTINKMIDTKIYDRRRLWRLPNTINGKTGLYKIPILAEELLTMERDEILRLAKAQRRTVFPIPENLAEVRRRWRLVCQKMQETLQAEEDARRARKEKRLNTGEIKEILPCVAELLEEGCDKGGRNNMSVAMASSLLQAGYSADEVTDILLGWNTKNRPPLPEREVIATSHSAYMMAQNERFYGCSFFADSGCCIQGCPIQKERGKAS